MNDVLVAERVTVTGIVQGVGFRPFVYRLATELGLSGHVGNDATQVFVEVAGPPAALAEFAHRLIADAPPLARVEHVARSECTAMPQPGFRIVASTDAVGARTLVPPDTVVCDECLAELFDPADRRYLHPFITCTNCGPRFTIIRDLPYDRPATTMATFAMCPACAAEYADPANRRYHAQPIGCHACGPRLTWSRVSRPPSTVPTEVVEPVETTGDPIAAARAALAAGQIVAVKGLGGYHLACLATSDAAVARLRQRKHRPDKPLAVLVPDLATARALAHVSDDEADLLTSPARPIVLLRARPGTSLSSLVAPGNPLVGVLLPYTPVHHLLFAGADGAPLGPLVMTSGNLAGAPLAYRDDEAHRRLAGLADALLTHDREIHVPCDDSVVRIAAGHLLPIRRARGYAPVPVAFPGARRPVLAVGGELKNTCCVSDGAHAWVSQHVGDMENLDTLRAFESIEARFRQMYAVEPELVAHDLHPGYRTTAWAREHHRDRALGVQHHHAHVAAVMAEHGLDPYRAVVGVAFDGTGYGTDGTIWGGELLVADATGFERVAHLAPVPLPGGDAAVRHPARVALAHLRATGLAWDDRLPCVAALTETERRVLAVQLDRGVACAATTSMGRLFDAFASLLGLRHTISFEAQAAIDLEHAALASSRTDRGYRLATRAGVLDPGPVWRAATADLLAGADPGDLAYAVHVAVAEATVEHATAVAADRGLDTVVLSGGVFQNGLLVELCLAGFAARAPRSTVLTHRLVPPNDGGLALGQAFVAAHSPYPSQLGAS
ncbi:MAG TPA: carbamoyltransferase HypF [Ilumatobacter sp.]|nr:carbamoyltransferase HypF [Ilumatobacter sp.]